MQRRSFLKGLLGLAAAPAICKAENLMKIYVPKQEIVVPETFKSGVGDYLTNTGGMDFGTGDFTVEAWIKPDVNAWQHVAHVHRGDDVQCYINGVLVHPSDHEALGFRVANNGREVRFNKPVVDGVELALGDRVLISNPSGPNGIYSVSDVRITDGIARSVDELAFKAQRAVSKFEAEANRGIYQMESFVKRAEAVARQETPSGLLAAILGRV